MSVITPVNRRQEELRYLCRTVGHHWNTYVPMEFAYTSLWRRANHYRCDNCGTCRHDAINLNGGLETRRYEYPDEYKMSGDDRPTSDELRAWMLKRNERLGLGPKFPKTKSA